MDISHFGGIHGNYFNNKIYNNIYVFGSINTHLLKKYL